MCFSIICIAVVSCNVQTITISLHNSLAEWWRWIGEEWEQVHGVNVSLTRARAAAVDHSASRVVIISLTKYQQSTTLSTVCTSWL